VDLAVEQVEFIDKLLYIKDILHYLDVRYAYCYSYLSNCMWATSILLLISSILAVNCLVLRIKADIYACTSYLSYPIDFRWLMVVYIRSLVYLALLLFISDIGLGMLMVTSHTRYCACACANLLMDQLYLLLLPVLLLSSISTICPIMWGCCMSLSNPSATDAFISISLVLLTLTIGPIL
jgi:hypothetical protein